MTKISDYQSPIQPTWCPGCGAYMVLAALKKTLSELEIPPHESFMTFDIGCSGNMADKIKVNGFKGLHGRAIPVAAGAKIANQDLTVIAITGEGGLLDEGIQHLIHSARSNYNILVLMNDNERFALTTGQPTPTTDPKTRINTAPWGVVESEINPLEIVLASKATFVARTYSGDLNLLTETLKSAIQHKGFAFVQNLQFCPSYNKSKTNEWFRENSVNVDEIEGYDNSSYVKAMDLLQSEDENQIPVGVIYQDKTSVPYLDRIPYIKKGTILKDQKEEVDVSRFVKKFY